MKNSEFKKEAETRAASMLTTYLEAIAPTNEPDWLLALNCDYIFVGPVDGENYSEGN